MHGILTIEIFCLQTRDSDRVAHPVNYIEKLNGVLCNSEKIERVHKIARAQRVQFVERVQFFPE